MAHTCPSCYAHCTCNGDWDDINFGDDPECTHCSADGRHSEDDLFPDDDEADQSVDFCRCPPDVPTATAGNGVTICTYCHRRLKIVGQKASKYEGNSQRSKMKNKGYWQLHEMSDEEIELLKQKWEKALSRGRHEYISINL